MVEVDKVTYHEFIEKYFPFSVISDSSPFDEGYSEEKQYQRWYSHYDLRELTGTQRFTWTVIITRPKKDEIGKAAWMYHYRFRNETDAIMFALSKRI